MGQRIHHLSTQLNQFGQHRQKCLSGLADEFYVPLPRISQSMHSRPTYNPLSPCKCPISISFNLLLDFCSAYCEEVRMIQDEN